MRSGLIRGFTRRLEKRLLNHLKQVKKSVDEPRFVIIILVRGAIAFRKQQLTEELCNEQEYRVFQGEWATIR